VRSQGHMVSRSPALRRFRQTARTDGRATRRVDTTREPPSSSNVICISEAPLPLTSAAGPKVLLTILCILNVGEANHTTQRSRQWGSAWFPIVEPTVETGPGPANTSMVRSTHCVVLVQVLLVISSARKDLKLYDLVKRGDQLF
jgi:hypothetical protein